METLKKTIELYLNVKTEREGRKLAISELGWSLMDVANYTGSWVTHFHNTAKQLETILDSKSKLDYTKTHGNDKENTSLSK